MKNELVLGFGACCLLFAAGCIRSDKLGERAGSCDGDESCAAVCPEGEVCSDATPAGLEFQVPGGVAVGGAITVGFERVKEGTWGKPLDVPWEAKTTDAIGLVEPLKSKVRIEGLAEGGGYLRIVEPETGHLYDRIWIDSVEPDRLEIHPPSGDYVPDFGVTWPDWAVLAGETNPVILRLISDEHGLLVDERREISVNGEVIAKESWTGEVTAPSVGALEISVKTGGGTVVSAQIQVVSAPDGIVPADLGTQEPDLCDDGAELSMKKSLTCCFRAEIGGTGILTPSWKISGAEGIEVQPLVEDAFPNCVNVTGTAKGPGKLTVTAGSFSRDFAYEVVD